MNVLLPSASLFPDPVFPDPPLKRCTVSPITDDLDTVSGASILCTPAPSINGCAMLCRAAFLIGRAILLIPTIRPCPVYWPESVVTSDGECIFSAELMAEAAAFAMLDAVDITGPRIAFIPLIRPDIIFVPEL